MPEIPETTAPPSRSFESLVWPQWLPVQARLPLVAQITGAVSLTALLVGPWWSDIPALPSKGPPALIPVAAPASPVRPEMTVRPAHLNLDVRHTFSSLDLTVTVDGERELHASLEGGGKRFKVFGERAERGYTRTLNLAPGVRLVGVRVRSAGDRFDQTRVERFELGSSAVAVMRIAADRSGLQVVAERPPELPPAARAPATAAPSPPAALHMAPPLAPVQAAAAPKNTGAVVELLQSLRSMLIAIAGFVASAATGFVVQEYLRKRKEPTFAEANRRRRRAGFAG